MRENNFNQCEIVQDLLPLYVDGVCSESSNKLVENHMKECSVCSNYHKQLKNEELDNQYEEIGNTVIKNHKRKYKIIMTAVLLLVFAAGLLTMKIAVNAFDSQYHSNGISKYMNITISDTGKYKVGELDGYEIYLENLSEAYFITAGADRIELEDAIEQGQISIEDLWDGSWQKEDTFLNGVESTIYYFENYQIVLSDKECVISPIKNPSQS